jgi:hypothetical protein
MATRLLVSDNVLPSLSARIRVGSTCLLNLLTKVHTPSPDVPDEPWSDLWSCVLILIHTAGLTPSCPFGLDPHKGPNCDWNCIALSPPMAWRWFRIGYQDFCGYKCQSHYWCMHSQMHECNIAMWCTFILNADNWGGP